MNFLAPGGAQWGMGVTFGAVQDDRGVRITSENDTTFKRGTDSTGAPVAIPDIPNASGVIYADMKAPSPPILFSTIYRANGCVYCRNLRPMAFRLAYVWHESQTGTEADGILAPPTHPSIWTLATPSTVPRRNPIACVYFLHGTLRTAYGPQAITTSTGTMSLKTGQRPKTSSILCRMPRRQATGRTC